MDILLKRIREEIVPLFEEATSNYGVAFNNPHIVKCWKTLDCKTSNCVLYGDESGAARCWQIAGTYCGGDPQGSFVQKYGTCANCEVFRKSCPSIVEELGEQFNNMVFLLKKQGQMLREDEQHITHLNQELKSAIEDLGDRERKIHQLLITDKLTGLFNRDYLMAVLEDEVARCKRYGHPLSMLIADIDGFKSFNDKYGYRSGDNMLSCLGGVIKENIRKFDRAFRYTGEKFIVLLPETDLTLAYIVAERIRKSFDGKSFEVNENGASLIQASRTMSIGIAATFSYKTNTVKAEDLFKQMEKALQHAKSKGGNISVRYECA